MGIINGKGIELLNPMVDILIKLIKIGHPFKLYKGHEPYPKEGIFPYNGENYAVLEIEKTEKDICSLLPENYAIQIEWHGGWYYRLYKYNEEGIGRNLIDWVACADRKIPCFEMLYKLYLIKDNVETEKSRS